MEKEQAPAEGLSASSTTGDATDSEEPELLMFTGKIYVVREGQYAVKRPIVLIRPELEEHYGSQEYAINELDSEKRIYRYLGPYDGIVKFCDDKPLEHAIRTIYVAPGDLRKYLESHEVDQPTQLRWCTMMARTVAWVHEKQVIIYDIRTPNWVVAEDGSIKLLDFGSAEIWPEDAPPEEVKVSEMTIEIELGMLGAVFYEIVARCQPSFRFWNGPNASLPTVEEIPNLDGIFLGDIIKMLWTGQFKSAMELFEALQQVKVGEIAF